MVKDPSKFFNQINLDLKMLLFNTRWSVHFDLYVQALSMYVHVHAIWLGLVLGVANAFINF